VPLRVDGAAGGDQRLPGHLTAVHPQRPVQRARPAEGHPARRLEVEHLEEEVDRRLADGDLGHRRFTVAGSTREPSWWTRSVLVEPGVPGGLPATTTT